jgi:hypothetical protein
VERLVQWDALEFRISGARIAERAREQIAGRGAPVQDLAMHFTEAGIAVSGKVIKFIPVPFRFMIRRVIVEDLTVRIPLEEFSAFGFLPLPKLMLQLFPDRTLADGVLLHPESMAVTILLDHFLPPFVDLSIDLLEFVEGGVKVRLGPGGADPPPEREEMNGRSH